MSKKHSIEQVVKLLVLLIGLEEVLGWPWKVLIRAAREDIDFDAGINGSNVSTTHETTTVVAPTPILTVDAITNIVLSGVAVMFITAVLCYLMITFNQVEHRARVRTALQRNKQIDRQIAAARARQQQQQQHQYKVDEQEELGEEGLKVETVGGAEDGRRLVPVVETLGDKERTNTKDTNETGNVAVTDLPETPQGTQVELVVEFEDKRSGTSSTVDDDDKPLINSVEGDTHDRQPNLVVQPAPPELV